MPVWILWLIVVGIVGFVAFGFGCLLGGGAAMAAHQESSGSDEA